MIYDIQEQVWSTRQKYKQAALTISAYNKCLRDVGHTCRDMWVEGRIVDPGSSMYVSFPRKCAVSIFWHLLPKKPGRQRHTGSPSIKRHWALFWQSDCSHGLVFCSKIMGGGFSQNSPLNTEGKKERKNALYKHSDLYEAADQIVKIFRKAEQWKFFCLWSLP